MVFQIDFKSGKPVYLQLVDQVPMEPHDQYMDILVTEQHLYDCRRIRHEKDSSVSR